MVGGFLFLFFYPGLWKDTKLFCLLPSLHLLPHFHSTLLPAPVLPGQPPTPPLFSGSLFSRLPGDLFCFLLCFFFCFECLSLQVSVAGRSPFRSQRLQCKFPCPLGECTTLFGGFWGCFLFFSFFSLPSPPFYLEGMGGSGHREVGGGFCLFF